MLTKENNDRLCRVGEGTPGSALFRSMWLPALLSSQLPEGSRTPVRLRLLGEDLIAFRNAKGEVGITSAYCLHRGAPLFFGKVEDDGIRCAYHGWKYGTDGQCVEMPSESNNKLCKNMMMKAYQRKEAADIIWTYRGEEGAPAQPTFHGGKVGAERRSASA